MRKLFVVLTVLFAVSMTATAQDIAKIPNIFTPNNDGINDVFQIRTNGVSAVTVSIYNRYGGLVYRYFGLNGTWDGHTHAGEPCVDGVYFVVAEFTLTDGSKSVQDQTLQLVR
ncbi:MAG: gliding motility-associated C-terminal domain-containing protein [Putridiphycobacter sp.]|nr:gliding motility-associated C-terminal domain-containing protein [Putridiphycobacter sp.]